MQGFINLSYFSSNFAQILSHLGPPSWWGRSWLCHWPNANEILMQEIYLFIYLFLKFWSQVGRKSCWDFFFKLKRLHVVFRLHLTILEAPRLQEKNKILTITWHPNSFLLIYIMVTNLFMFMGQNMTHTSYIPHDVRYT